MMLPSVVLLCDVRACRVQDDQSWEPPSQLPGFLEPPLSSPGDGRDVIRNGGLLGLHAIDNERGGFLLYKGSFL